MFRKIEDLDSRERKLLIALASLLIILIVALESITYVSKTKTLYIDNTATMYSYNATKQLIPSEGIRTIQLQQDRITGISMQYVSINKHCVFPNGETPGNVRIENRPDNAYAIQVELVELQDGQTLMKTGLIDPGFFVEYRKLDTLLSKGHYTCVAKFTMYDLVTFEVIGSASTQVLVVIEA